MIINDLYKRHLSVTDILQEYSMYNKVEMI